MPLELDDPRACAGLQFLELRLIVVVRLDVPEVQIVVAAVADSEQVTWNLAPSGWIF